jgi:CheY-like chemotaxis protein
MASPLATIPIIALTGAAMDADVERALLAGVNDVVFKPVEPATVLSHFEKISPKSS